MDKVFIHPNSEVYTSEIGENTKIWQFTIILKNASIGENCNINCHVFIENNVMIGNNVTVKSGVQIWDGVTIEDHVFIGPNVTFTNDKWPKSKNQKFELLKTKIQKGVSIGANSTILCGISIGKFSLIGAGSVVTKNIPDRALVVGNPAKIIGWMNEDGTKMKKINDYHYLDKDGLTWKIFNQELVKI